MKLSAKLILMSVLFLLNYLAAVVPAYWGLWKLDPNNSAVMAYMSAIKNHESADMMHDALRGDVIQALLAVKTGEKSFGTHDEISESIADHLATFESSVKNSDDLVLAPEARAALDEVKPAIAVYGASAKKIVSQAWTPNADLTSDFESFMKDFTSLEDKMEAVTNVLTKYAEESRNHEMGVAAWLRWTMVMISVLGIILAAVVSWLTIRSVVGPLDRAISRLLGSSENLNSTATEVAHGGTSLSSQANDQAAAIQETVAAMTEMSSMVSQTAQHARDSLGGAQKMAAKAEDGGKTMEQMVASMESIQQANNQLQDMTNIISQISAKTAVINDIVFKTQLLSFNASIEAARAGQHGRGFAVVAEEVGNLAEMSGNAAKEIQALLEDSKKSVAQIVDMTRARVEDGQTVSKESLQIFSQLAREIQAVSSLVEGINSATKEQQTGIEQASAAMTQMDRGAQKINALARSSSESARSMSDQGTELSTIVSELTELVYGKGARGRGAEFSRSSDNCSVVELDQPIDEVVERFKGRSSARAHLHEDHVR